MPTCFSYDCFLHTELDFKIESDGEPPSDQVGDVLKIVKKDKVLKEILRVCFT